MTAFLKLRTGVYITAHNDVSITLIKTNCGHWEAIYRNPNGCRLVVKITRRTRGQAFHAAVCSLDDDSKIFQKYC
jgi:hypothetical protein